MYGINGYEKIAHVLNMTLRMPTLTYTDKLSSITCSTYISYKANE